MSFERGETYYRDGAVLEPVRQEMELRAQICHAVLDEAVRGYDDKLRKIR